MGSDHGRASRALTRVARVVPDVASFSVDDGFSYSMPPGVSVEVGALVRVPLSGRRVRGWVVEVGEGDGTGLKPIAARSGDVSVFDRRLLEVIRWAAIRYVAPLATLLAKAGPPNLPRASGDVEAVPDRRSVRPPTEVWVGRGSWSEEIAARVDDGGVGAVVVAPTGLEAGELAAGLGARLGKRVIPVLPDFSAARQTSAWVRAATRDGAVLIGTRGVAFWPVRNLATAFVVGEGRRGMKDKATPTTHAREVLRRRSQVERFGLVLAGVVPTAEAVSLASPRRTQGRTWGHVEVVDRRAEDEMHGAVLGSTARAALRAAVAAGTKVLVFTHRRTSAQRCARCRTLRVCGRCGSGSFDAGSCSRCELPSTECLDCGFGRFEMLGFGVARVKAETARVVGRSEVGDPGSGASVIVGTERDLPGLQVGLTIVVDADGPLLAPTYRAAEDGFRLLARAVAAAGAGRGRRGLLQTSNPDHAVFEALRRGDPVPYVAADAASRSAAGFPPGGELLVVEVDDPPPAATEEMTAAIGDRAQVLGPADHRGRSRWLLQGGDLTAARIALRGVVATWRDGGARVRVDADPIDL